MQTTGLASRPIGELYEGERLAEALADARERTLGAYAHLDLARLEFPCIAIVNPALWELAHIAWFQEHWCLRQRTDGGLGPSLLADADALFNSSTVPHDSRWHLPYPPERVLRAYMADTLQATLDALERTPEEGRYFFKLALLHEDMHGEALLMTLQTLGLAAPPLGAYEPPRGREEAAFDVCFAGGEVALGTARGEKRFTFDNEKWSHPVRVESFSISSLPVRQGDFAAFAEDGGYARRDLWSAEGWAWRERSGREAPRGWRREGATWAARRFDRTEAIDPSAPMVHVSLHEARAWCRWAGRRLPTEAEWEFAARNGGAGDRFPWGEAPLGDGAMLDFRHAAPAIAPDPAPSRSGLRLMLGGVWEWTASPFEPYPGFRPDPYRDYSEPWFHTHFVLRGGSFATRSRLVHNRFRNFYVPDRDDVFAGLRTCAVEEGRGVS
ncbi:MAG TPA: selenoneine synthase SenA [Usitatibacter sp.]|nr:selenoneine synthase SenA [Usitatibacter sp.]